MATTARPSFGIMTPPMNVGYHDIVRVWREADEIPSIQHAWLFDHLMPIGGDLDGPIFEGWTLLAALAAQTSRLRLGLMVTSNRFRPPAVLAKIATTVDIVSGGRLDFGIGAGSRPSIPIARHEYVAHGLPYHDSAHAVGSLAEACTIVRRLWTEDTPFDFDGAYHHLEGAFGNPKPVQRPGPPIVIGGRSTATLRVVAEHADIWNIPGGDIADATARSAMLDRFCTDIGRDPSAITRSMFLPVSSDRPEMTRAAVTEALDAGFPHIVLGLSAPYVDGVVQAGGGRNHRSTRRDRLSGRATAPTLPVLTRQSIATKQSQYAIVLREADRDGRAPIARPDRCRKRFGLWNVRSCRDECIGR